MTNWPGPITAITLFADDLPAMKAFYIEVFELPVFYEDDASCVFQFGEQLINVLDAAEAPSLTAPVVPGGAGTPPRFQFTLTVDDVDLAAAALVDKGVALLNGPQDRDWGIRTAAFADPSGHIWEIAAPLTQTT